MPSSFRTDLITRFTDDGTFIVHEPFEFESCVTESILRVPVGLTTDFASIPWGLRNILSPTGRYGKAAVVHDMLYKTRGAGTHLVWRDEADAVLLEGMEVLDVPRWQRWAIYAGIRLGGWLTWWRYRRMEKRR